MDKVTLNEKEQRRMLVLNEVIAGRLTGSAAELLGLSLRQTRRLLAGYRWAGASGLAHGNRGREPVNKVSAAVAEAVAVGRALDRSAVRLLALPYPGDADTVEPLLLQAIRQGSQVEFLHGEAAERAAAAGGILAQLYYALN